VSEEFVQYFISLDREYDIKKLLFTIAVWGKINLELGFSEYYSTSFDNYRDLKISAGVKIKGDIYETLFNKFYDEKTLRLTSKGTIHNLFISNIPDGEPIYKIKDLAKIGRWFDFYNGVNRLYQCEKCGETFENKEIKSNNIKLCKNCKPKPTTNTMLFTCGTCGEMSFVSAKSHAKKMCNKCFKVHQKEYNKQKYQETFKTTNLV
jgi:hypothetical protein